MADIEADDTHELAGLKDLIQSEGWRVLTAHAEKEWGPAAYGWRVKHARANLPTGEARDEELAGIDAASTAVANLMAYPVARIAQLTGPKKAHGPFEKLRRIAR